jgi:hypothetical protein
LREVSDASKKLRGKLHGGAAVPETKTRDIRLKDIAGFMQFVATIGLQL